MAINDPYWSSTPAAPSQPQSAYEQVFNAIQQTPNAVDQNAYNRMLGMVGTPTVNPAFTWGGTGGANSLYQNANTTSGGQSLAQVAAGPTSAPAPTAAPAPAAPTTTPGAGGLPPINPGEDSMSYMLRIGMNPADAQAALAMSRQNPGMSFQDIISKGGFNIPGWSQGGAQITTLPGEMPGTQGAVGTSGPVSGLGGVNGVPGYGGNFDINNWQDPGYAFRLAQGMKALQGSAAASGGLLSGPTLKAITDYSQGAASQEYQNAFNRFAANRQFNYGVDTGDRAFDYMTQQGDQQFNLNLLNTMLGQGQYGTSGSAQANNLLASILSGNALTAGQVAGQGTIGAGNAVTNALNQGINYYLQQNNPMYQAVLASIQKQQQPG